jgi:hypothetical protein
MKEINIAAFATSSDEPCFGNPSLQPDDRLAPVLGLCATALKKFTQAANKRQPFLNYFLRDKLSLKAALGVARKGWASAQTLTPVAPTVIKRCDQ